MLAKVIVKKKEEKSATIRIEKIIKWDWIRFQNFLKFWTVHNYMQNFGKLQFSKGETVSPTLLI